jgi:DNA modification methylase
MEPDWQTDDGAVRLYCGDSHELLPQFDAEIVSSVVTDPPYGLTANKKGGSGAASINTESPYGRARIGTGNGGGGFMGMAWDSDVPPVALWEACLRVLKPGGHLLAFAGTRTHHRIASRVEDAGFEIRDMIAWVYGSGFPKSMDVGKAIDKAAGAVRPRYARAAFGGTFSDDGGTTYGTAIDETPLTREARRWDGWGTALKPALEPITMARKAFAGTVAANVLQHGTGALNIDASRVASNGESRSREHEAADERQAVGATSIAATAGAFRGGDPAGRWPANLIHDGSDEVVDRFPLSKSGSSVSGSEPSKTGTANCYGEYDRVPFAGHSDDGSAARFFYCAKASSDERGEGNIHPTVKPLDLMAYLCRLVTPPGGTILDPFLGSGTTAVAAYRAGFSFIGIERERKYFDIAVKRITEELGRLRLFEPAAVITQKTMFTA